MITSSARSLKCSPSAARVISIWYLAIMGDIITTSWEVPRGPYQKVQHPKPKSRIFRHGSKSSNTDLVSEQGYITSLLESPNSRKKQETGENSMHIIPHRHIRSLNANQYPLLRAGHQRINSIHYHHKQQCMYLYHLH